MAQSQVSPSVAYGVAGSPATPDQLVHHPLNLIAEENCAVGNFCFQGSNAMFAKQSSEEEVQPIGILQRVINYPNYMIGQSGTLVVPEGSPLTIVTLGNLWVNMTNSSSEGEAVFASLTDGSLTSAAAGTTVAGSVETTWRVVVSGLVGEASLISNWGEVASVPPASE